MIALSPEWDHWFDEAFADLVTRDPDLVQAEFDSVITGGWPPDGTEDQAPGIRDAPRSDSW